jgi:hypothetical protein
MHPILQSWRRFLTWAAVWIPFGMILVLVAHFSGRMGMAEAAAVMGPPVAVLSFVCLAPYYVCKALPLRSAQPRKLMVNHGGAAVVLSIGVVLIGRFSALLWTPTFPGVEDRFRDAAPILMVMVLLIYEMSVALHYAALELEASRRAELLARDAQLKALKAQVNPHFLFNSLNSISALTSIDAAEARRMCIGLAEFLRTSLRLGERVSIPFSEELALTGMYLDVERVRFGDRLRVAHDIDEACGPCEVPALIIQPLVENAVKHGIAMMAEGGEIAMTGRYDQGLLRFRISNPFDPEAPSAGRNGIGLVNIRERLESRYGSAARLEIAADERTYRVTLTLPAKQQKTQTTRTTS